MRKLEWMRNETKERWEQHPDFPAGAPTATPDGSATDDNSTGPQVSRNRLLSDLANLTERNTRLVGHVARLEQGQSEASDQDARRATGLGTPADTDTLQRRVGHLEQQVSELRNQLSDAKKTSRHPEPPTEG